MGKFDFLLKKHFIYSPRTPQAALKAFEAGILPLDYFIYHSTSIHSLNNKPYDIELINRLLRNKKLDFPTSIFLINIFEDMLETKDAEISIFAAEGINRIENFYIEKIEKFRKKVKKQRDQKNLGILSRLYFELALLNAKRQAIKKFYLKEAYYAIKDIMAIEKLNMDNLIMLVKILIELKLFDQAIKVLNQIIINNQTLVLYLKAEVEFKRKNFTTVYNIMRQFKMNEDVLKMKNSKEVISYWMQ